MDMSRNDLLGELAADAALERTDFLVQATEQLRRFLDATGSASHVWRPDADRRGPRLPLDRAGPDVPQPEPLPGRRTGEWVTETEVIESAAELVELYNPADIYAAFAEAGPRGGGLAPSRPPPTTCSESAGIAPEETVPLGRGPVRRRGRLVGRRPGRVAGARGRRGGRARGCTTSRSSSRSAASAARRG